MITNIIQVDSYYYYRDALMSWWICQSLFHSPKFNNAKVYCFMAAIYGYTYVFQSIKGIPTSMWFVGWLSIMIHNNDQPDFGHHFVNCNSAFKEKATFKELSVKPNSQACPKDYADSVL